jgi:hypothetical protein
MRRRRGGGTLEVDGVGVGVEVAREGVCGREWECCGAERWAGVGKYELEEERVTFGRAIARRCTERL